MEQFTIIVVYSAMILCVIVYVIAVYAPKKYIIFPATALFLCCLIFGLCINGFPLGLLSGLFIGVILEVLTIFSGLLGKYYSKKGLERLREFNKRKN
jgi:hypothetical protein